MAFANNWLLSLKVSLALSLLITAHFVQLTSYASLHATPMWLMAMYMPAFEPVNRYFAPSQWIHLSVMMFEIFTVFVPSWQVLRQRRLSKRAADSNTKWETESQTTTLRMSVSLAPKSISLAEQGHALDLSDVDLGDRLLTMNALNYVLNNNPGPLQEFSALRDFSGENIAFLTRTAKWKASWPENASEDQMQTIFTRALEIYTDFIGPRDAEFPLNLSSHNLKRFEAIFERPARIVCGEARSDPATPFAADVPLRSLRKGSDDAATASSGGGGSGSGRIDLGEVVDRIQYTGEISEDFDATVFDDAEAHVKYLVLTNTWPKFVNEWLRTS